ncbi:MAG: HAD family phosphatase [Actinobacteria bacterium]|nr:MAG: HAD family phosphatase [Actinomycetota bacterium]
MPNVDHLSIADNLKNIKKLVTDLKVIYTDVDGTMLGPDGSLFLTSSRNLSLYPAKALIKARTNNIDVVMVSGRSARQLFGDARILGLRNYIAELGCQVEYDLGKESNNLSGNLKIVNGQTLHQAITNTGAIDSLFKHYKGYLEYHTPWSEGRKCTHVFRGYIDLAEANALLDSKGFFELQIIDNGVIGRRGTLNDDIAEVHAYHLLPEGCGKEEGLAFDIQKRGFLKTQTIAIGDALSDLPLAREVGALFLVKNAISKFTKGIKEEILKYDNVFVTEAEMNIGFSEVIFSLLGY